MELEIKTKELEGLEVERLVHIIIDQKDAKGLRYLEKYSKDWLIEMINGEKMKIIEQKFSEYDKSGVDVVDFAKIFLSVFENHGIDTIYLISCFIEIYKEVCEGLGLPDQVKFSNVTNYIVENFIERNMNNYFLPTKKIPEKKHIDPDPAVVREIDIHPPTIFGTNNTGVKRLLKSKIITDRNHHNNQKVMASCYSAELKKIFTLDTLSDHLKVYDKDCRLIKKITPQMEKKNRDLIIMSFAFSHKT